MKQWIIGGLIVLVLIASYLWNRNAIPGEEETIPVEEILVQEDGSVVKKVGSQIEVLSDEEIIAKRSEFDEKLSAAQNQTVELESPQGASMGASEKVFTDGQYIQKVTVSGLPSLNKGSYYEVWIQSEDGTKTSLGRIEMSGTNGTLYYSASEDKTNLNTVVVTREVEDGNLEMGEVVLKGSFTLEDGTEETQE
jgi:hypothetical protein